jgi:putative two-component system response regulator
MALTETLDKVRAFGVGGVDYISKPFQFEEVQARVETHLELRRLQNRLREHNQHLERLVKAKTAEIHESQLATILALAALAESRDHGTGEHLDRTRTFCKMFAQKLRGDSRYAGHVDEAFVENIFLASPLHDIGKVGIPDHVLLKPDKLTPDEFEIMKTHTVIGAHTLQTVHAKYPGNTFLQMGIAIARSHHEKWDGAGYPDALAAGQIPLSARIMAIADVYDALRSQRAYKPPLSHEKAVGMILEGAGRQFDPILTEVFRAAESEFAQVSRQFAEATPPSPSKSAGPAP